MKQSWSFDIFVAPGFVTTEFAAAVDVLRLTNRVSTKRVFEWRFLSACGGPVESSSAATIMTEPVPTRPDADYLVVLGNVDPAHPDLSLGLILGRYKARQSRIVLLAEAASRYNPLGKSCYSYGKARTFRNASGAGG
jgi:transcriptional regulator GlxA family with amidase domain